MTKGIKEAPSHKKARVLVKKRKDIPPSNELTSKTGIASKRKKKFKPKSKPKAVAPTPDNPVVVEDEDKEASSASMEAIYEVVPIQQKMPKIKIREPEVVVPGSVADIPF